MKRPASVTEIKTDDYLMSLVDGLRALYEVDVSTGAYRAVTQGCVPSVAGEPLKEGNDFFADLGPTSIDKASIVRALASSTFAEYPVTPAVKHP